jgi:hypothetical protein
VQIIVEATVLKRAVNLIAARYANKAVQYPIHQESVLQAAASYNGRAPQSQDIFMARNEALDPYP